MPRSVADIAGGSKEFVRAIAGLDPLQIEQLAHEVLRQRLPDLEILVRREKVERSGRAIVPTADRFRQVMKIIDSAAAAQKRADIVGQPQPSPDIHVSFRRGGRKI